MSSIQLDVDATIENFDEEAYLAANADVARALKNNTIKSGFDHFRSFGVNEKRKLRVLTPEFKMVQKQKIDLLMQRYLRHPPVRMDQGKPDFIDADTRKNTGISDTDAVSAHGYDAYVRRFIAELPGGMILDCGAGRRPEYYDNIVNYEIVNYDTTDVVGVGEVLPFKDACFDGVISMSVLEHVRDPFACASEIVRVLKPGGKLICCVPLLQPEHGYPHHYYNMTRQGLRALFERRLTIDDHKVIETGRPIAALRWIITRWGQNLPQEVRDQFLSLSLGQIVQMDHKALEQAQWNTSLSTEANFELACATMMFAHKD